MCADGTTSCLRDDAVEAKAVKVRQKPWVVYTQLLVPDVRTTSVFRMTLHGR